MSPDCRPAGKEGWLQRCSHCDRCILTPQESLLPMALRHNGQPDSTLGAGRFASVASQPFGIAAIALQANGQILPATRGFPFPLLGPTGKMVVGQFAPVAAGLRRHLAA